MSTSTARTPARSPRHETSARPPLGRLTSVELRKAVDTRAGRWLMVVIAAVSLGMAAVQAFAGAEQAGDYAFWLVLQQIPVGFLVPVLAVLVVTSEWSARTGLGTFALVPRRQRVLAAKLGAVLLLTLAAFLFSAAMTAVGTALGSAFQDVAADWDLTWWQVVQPLASLGVRVLVGFALGLLLLSSPAAIVLLFAVPALLPLLFLFVTSITAAGPWVDWNTALNAIGSDQALDGTQWLQIATASALWVLLPAALGARRVQRSEIG